LISGLYYFFLFLHLLMLLFLIRWRKR